MLKLLHQCLEELSKFNSECSSFETWLTAAEEKVKASQGRTSKPQTLEQREAAHEVLNFRSIQLVIYLAFLMIELCCRHCGKERGLCQPHQIYSELNHLRSKSRMNE